MVTRPSAAACCVWVARVVAYLGRGSEAAEVVLSGEHVGILEAELRRLPALDGSALQAKRREAAARASACVEQRVAMLWQPGHPGVSSGRWPRQRCPRRDERPRRAERCGGEAGRPEQHDAQVPSERGSTGASEPVATASSTRRALPAAAAASLAGALRRRRRKRRTPCPSRRRWLGVFRPESAAHNRQLA